MPISSSEIAQLNGAYQQQYAQQAQFASQMSGGNIYGGGPMGGSMGSGMQGDQLMSRGMNRAAGIGVPLAAAGMSLMGLDPFSIGLKAGGLASASGMGMAGAIGVGAGVALPLMAGLGAAKYAGSQMMEGASQQSNLNQTLRSSFNFRNSAGGQGFQRADMTEIGSMVRDMSGQFGPGGEITGFKELTSLAGKMGTMGFAQGVRDVKEFSSKFKEMVTTLKGMAKDLGTTLEGAMEFAQAAKGSGVFGMGNMAKFTGAAAAGTRGTGLALSEFTGAASIGSQISRSIGGLGKQGAAAGLRTMEQIGTATKMGVLSEEDIYNATGQSGAEGRQAYAASQLQKASEFLQTSKGRRFLASIAGKNGTLDEGGVQEVLSGGMDVEETRKRDNQMKTSVGRANFIRNEGRLRGAALERFGGNVAVMQMAEWAQGKGIDLNSTEGQDRGRLFMQRQLHMGRDDIDVAMKIVNAMPAIDRKMQQSHEDEAYFSKLAQERKQRGIEGVEQRFKQAQAKINGKMQEAGQNLINSGSEALDRWINKLTGTYEHVMTEKADNAFRNMKWGGNDREVARTMGGGASPFGRGDPAKQTSMSTQDFFGGSGEKLLQSLGYTDGSPLFGKTMAQKYKEAGYNIKEGSQADLQESLLEADQTAAGASRLNSKLGEADGDLMNTLRREYLGKMAGLSGQARVEAVRNVLEEQARSGNKSAQNMLANFGKGAGEQAASVNTLEQQIGISDDSLLSKHSAVPEGGTGGGDVPGGRAKNIADLLYGEQNQTAGRLVGGGLGGVLGMGMPVAAMAGAWLGGRIQSSISGDDAKRKAMGESMLSDKTRARAFDLFGGGGAGAMKETQAVMQQELMSLASAHQEKSVDAGTTATLLAAQEYARLQAKYPKGIPDDEIAKLTKTYGAYGIDTKEKLSSAYNAVKEAVVTQSQAVNQEEARRVRTRAQEEQKKVKDLGLNEIDPKTGKSKLVEGLSKEGEAAVRRAQEVLEMEASYSGTERERNKIRGAERMNIDALAHLSEKERAKIATNAAGTDLGSTMATINADEKRFSRGVKRGQYTQTAIGGLGLSLSKDQMKTMNLTDETSRKRLEAFMLENLGGKGLTGSAREELQTQIHTLTTATKNKDAAGYARAYESIQGDSAVQDQQKKKQDEQEDQNPAVREAKKQTSILEKMLKFQGMTASEISELNDKAQAGSAEDTGGGGSFHNGPNKGRGP